MKDRALALLEILLALTLAWARRHARRLAILCAVLGAGGCSAGCYLALGEPSALARYALFFAAGVVATVGCFCFDELLSGGGE